MVDSKIIIFLVTQLMKRRKQILHERLKESHKNLLVAFERRQRKHQRILECLKQDYILSIVAAVNKQSRRRRTKTYPRSDQHWKFIQEPQNEELYFETLRMTKSSFLSLCNLIQPYLPKQESHLTIPVSPEKQIAICLYKLASSAEYRLVGDIFGVHKSTVHKYFYIVLDAILKLTNDLIKFPNLEESLQIAKNFEKIAHFPNIIGVIDSFHIPVLPSTKGYLSFINREGWTSMIMQAIVDDNCIFRNVSIQLPGSVDVAKAFEKSGIFTHANQVIPQFTTLINDVATPLMLVGDMAYPLMPWLMKPYAGRLTPNEESFNFSLSAVRECIGNAFDRLKGRWRCLSKRTDISTVMLPKVVVACTILHNFCESQNERYCTSWNVSEQTKDPFPQPNDIICDKIIPDDYFDPNEIRENIKKYLSLKQNKLCS